MTLHTRAVIWLLTLVALSDTAAHAQPSSKFRPAANAIGWDRYVVTLQLRPGDDPAAIAEQLAATYRGRLEPFAREDFTVGLPVKREREATEDLEGAAVEMHYVPYDRPPWS